MQRCASNRRSLNTRVSASSGQTPTHPPHCAQRLLWMMGTEERDSHAQTLSLFPKDHAGGSSRWAMIVALWVGTGFTEVPVTIVSRFVTVVTVSVEPVCSRGVNTQPEWLE